MEKHKASGGTQDFHTLLTVRTGTGAALPLGQAQEGPGNHGGGGGG